MTTRTRRILTTAFAASLAIAGCGGEDAGDSTVQSAPPTTTDTTTTDTTAAPTSTAPTTTAPTDIEAVDIDAWVGDVNTAWRQYGTDSFDLLLAQGDASRPGWGTLDYEIAYVDSLSTLATSLLTALDAPPPELSESAEAWTAEIQQTIDRYTAILEGIDELGLPGETSLEVVPAETLEAVFEPFPDYLDLQVGCFDLASAVADLGGDIVDCANSEGGDDEQSAGGSLSTGSHDIDTPGLVSFDTVPLPFAFEVADSASVVVGDREVEFFIEEAGEAPFFHVVAVESVVDPAAITDAGPENGFALDQLVPLDDFDTWMDQLPFEVERGTSTVGDTEIRYWRLLDIEWDGGDLPMYGWAESSISGAHLITPGSVFWQVPHPDGLLVVYANRVVEAPDDVTSVERLAIGEAFLESLVVPG